ncbi:MAG: TIGR00730 family Rossman fold protein, partial [Acetobacteraceae bacterium]
MPEPIRSVAVFCGSRHGSNPAHAAAAQAMGKALAEAGMALVYGGGGVGLMGVVAEAAIAAGGRVHGVIPEFLTRIERIYPAVAELEVTDSMHSRKTRMFELADAFIAIPGGLGTIDELVEIVTWRQLGLHDKPVLVLDEAGWAQPFVALVEALIAGGFVAPAISASTRA